LGFFYYIRSGYERNEKIMNLFNNIKISDMNKAEMITLLADKYQEIQAELTPLSAKLFGDDKFKVFTQEEEQSKDFIRYNELIKQKQNYLFEKYQIQNIK